ncbi:MAG: hypothetical protein JST00_18830 [Deltaproteobacteria bacterium]|nr:hypothetical protein [Deltaproteobacteria bacterium]
MSEALRRWFEDRETMIRIDGYGQSDTVYPAGTTTAGCQPPTGNGH